MLTCEQTQHLFDAYLDDELSSSLRSEVHTHRLECSRCNRQLALLECCGDTVAGMPVEPALEDDFTDRVLSEITLPQTVAGAGRGSVRLYRLFAPMAAAAAVLALMVFVAPPIRKKTPEVMVVASAEPTVAPQVKSAIAETAITPAGSLGIKTVDAATGQTRTTGIYTEASVSLAEMMIEQSLVPTAQGWDRIQLNNTALRELGRMVLLRSISGLHQSTEGQEITPASQTPAALEVPLEPTIESFNVERQTDGFLPL